jgi:hypothetical protein
MRKTLIGILCATIALGAAGCKKAVEEKPKKDFYYTWQYAPEKVGKTPEIEAPRTLEDFFLQNKELENIKIPKGDFISPQIIDKVEDYGPEGREYPYDSRALRGGSKVYFIPKIEEDSEEREFSLTALEFSSPEEAQSHVRDFSESPSFTRGKTASFMRFIHTKSLSPKQEEIVIEMIRKYSKRIGEEPIFSKGESPDMDEAGEGEISERIRKLYTFNGKTETVVDKAFEIPEDFRNDYGQKEREMDEAYMRESEGNSASNSDDSGIAPDYSTEQSTASPRVSPDSNSNNPKRVTGNSTSRHENKIITGGLENYLSIGRESEGIKLLSLEDESRLTGLPLQVLRENGLITHYSFTDHTIQDGNPYIPNPNEIIEMRRKTWESRNLMGYGEALYFIPSGRGEENTATTAFIRLSVHLLDSEMGARELIDRMGGYTNSIDNLILIKDNAAININAQNQINSPLQARLYTKNVLNYLRRTNAKISAKDEGTEDTLKKMLMKASEAINNPPAYNFNSQDEVLTHFFGSTAENRNLRLQQYSIFKRTFSPKQ